MFPFNISPKHIGQNLDRCEEIVLIDAWLKIRPRIGDVETWAKDFEDRFFGSEKGVSERILEKIDKHLKRLNLPLLNFRTSGITPYMRIRHQEKIDARHKLLEDLKTAANRDAIVAAARAEMANLPPYHEPESPADTDDDTAGRHRAEALERARVEQRRQEEEGRRAEIARAREALAEAGARAAQRTAAVTALGMAVAALPQATGLVGGLEAVLLQLSAKLDVLAAQGELHGLELAELGRRVETLSQRLSTPVVGGAPSVRPQRRVRHEEGAGKAEPLPHGEGGAIVAAPNGRTEAPGLTEVSRRRAPRRREERPAPLSEQAGLDETSFQSDWLRMADCHGGPLRRSAVHHQGGMHDRPLGLSGFAGRRVRRGQ